MKPLLSEPELQDWLNMKRRADVIRWLETRHIPYEIAGGGRVVTTLEAVQRRFRDEEEEFDFGQAS